jgi:hypothetical protein
LFLVALLLACTSAAGSNDLAAPTSTSVPTTARPTTTTEAPTTTQPTTTTAAPTTTTTTPPVLRAPTAEAPLDTLILGDSTAYEVGNAIVRSNADGLLHIEVLYKTSSGMSRPDFFDWPYYIDWALDNRPTTPEVMILSLGANDAQDLHAPDGSIHVIPSDGWRAEYMRRVEELSKRVTEGGTTLYWVGQPLALDPGYSQNMSIINGVYAEVAERLDHVGYIDIWPALGNAHGGYRRNARMPDGSIVRIRAEDDIHLTDAGGDLAAALVMDHVRDAWEG